MITGTPPKCLAIEFRLVIKHKRLLT